jgi:hypothetical protein
MNALSSAITVNDRFTKFLETLGLTQAQISDGIAKRESVCKALNSNYYRVSNGTADSIYVGSWGKGARIRPPRDVDVLFRLPDAIYHQYQQRTGNKQSQLLQEVKGVLAASFPRTDIRGDGPVVKVPFLSFNVELVPAFKLTNGQYWIPITTNGGSYKTFDPDAEVTRITESNIATNGNTRDIVRMMKCWQAYCSVPLKSFYIELVAIEFLKSWEHAGKSKVYYDYMVRDFLKFLIGKAHGYVFVPGTVEMISLGDAWKSRAQSAYDRALKACQFEADKKPYSAGEQWQKIFGTDIPIS